MASNPGALSLEIDGRRRVLCCHSGTLSGRYPPNSLAAVAECVEAGVPRLEVDVRFMADDSMLIFHDASLNPATTMSGVVGQLEYSDIASARYRDTEEHGLCCLEDIVELVRGSRTLLQVDLKLMRPISDARAAKLVSVLRPLGEQVIVGSQAHWNLRRLTGVPVAFDPTLHWHFDPRCEMEEARPVSLGVYGLWDDSPLAGVRHATAEQYIENRIQDLRALVPQAVEWMVDIGTILHLASLGASLGERLRADACDLAAWTLHDTTAERAKVARRLFELGVTTIISDAPLEVAGDFAGGVL